MRKARFTEYQIIAVLKSVKAIRTVKDVCLEAAISEASYYNWKAKYGGMEASDISFLTRNQLGSNPSSWASIFESVIKANTGQALGFSLTARLYSASLAGMRLSIKK